MFEVGTTRRGVHPGTNQARTPRRGVPTSKFRRVRPCFGVAKIALCTLTCLLMRAVIQRVTAANVVVAGAVKGEIGHGLLVLLAVEETDAAADIEWLSGQTSRQRFFHDDQGLLNCWVQD